MKIQSTRNYRMFTRTAENRQTDIKKHKALVESMKKYGSLKEFPIVVLPAVNGARPVKDGQHRLTIAESLGLPVHWVEASCDWDVAVVNSTAKGWQLRDYAEKWAENGQTQYRDGLDFADRHHLNIGPAFCLLAGTTSLTNIIDDFRRGTFRITDRKWADQVALVYVRLASLTPPGVRITTAPFIGACMAVCRVKDFDPERMAHKAERCREQLVPYGNREAYLTMMESIYNFGAKGIKQVPLKLLAEQAMTDRSCVGKPPIRKKEKKAAA